jgi:hypothetical protein
MLSLRRLFICFPGQSVSDGNRRNEPHLPILYSRRVDGVIHPRPSKDPFLEGNVLLLEVASMSLNLHRRCATVSAESHCYSSTWPRSRPFLVRTLELPIC